LGTYIIGDIHGCFDEWISLKNRIEEIDSKAIFILVGDIIDRGLETISMLEWAMKNITPDGKYQMVIGNHEFEKIDWIESYIKQVDQAQSKGRNFNLEQMTDDNYDFRRNCLQANISNEKLTEILYFFESLSYYKDLKVDTEKRRQHYIIVHGGIKKTMINKDESFKKMTISNYDNDALKRCITQMNKEYILWDRNYKGNGWLKKTIIIHGHTPTFSKQCTSRGAISGKIWYNYCDINIDCGLVYRRNTNYQEANLAAIRLDDLYEFYLYT
jgi:serine/threonine protein phosphatase 1